ncbi:hypothetical protein Tco_0464577 [Tanacetum coccineum]
MIRPGDHMISVSENAVSLKPESLWITSESHVNVGSIVPLVKPLDIKKLESSSYQALGACFNPYTKLSSEVDFFWIDLDQRNLTGPADNIDLSFSGPFKNAVFHFHLIDLEKTLCAE